MEPIRYPVVNIFTSIQGEGHHMGKQATFIRLGGCNLACPFCDTASEMEMKNATMMTSEEIVAKIESEFIVITGGEPTIYNLKPLLSCIILKVPGAPYIAIETNGTNVIPADWLIDWVTVSPKPPLYKVAPSWVHELKYVVDEGFDASNIKFGICSDIWLQPESHKRVSIDKALKMVMQDSQLRMGIQLHKILGVV